MTEWLPTLKARDVISALERAGFIKSRMSGSHCRLIYPNDPTRKITVPIHTKDLKRGTLRGFIARSGLTVAEFVALL